MIIAIETSAEPASIALLHPDGSLSERSFPNQNQVNVPLADELALCLDELKGEVQTVLVGAGPGSYSGARVGLATAEALALSFNCDLVTLPSVYGITHPTPYVLVGDARRGAYFSISPEAPTPQILEAEPFAAQIAECDHALVTFEPVEKLPLSDEVKNSISITTSSATQLIHYWQTLSTTAQSAWLQAPREVVYLRPPNITKAKSPF